jgi:hypothetical protein
MSSFLVFSSLLTEDTVSHVGIFDPSCELAPLYISHWFIYPTSPLPLTCVSKYRGVYVFIQCVRGGGGIGGLRQINTCRQVPILVNLNTNLYLGFNVFIDISSMQYGI